VDGGDAEPFLALLVQPLVQQVQHGVDAVGFRWRRPLPIPDVLALADRSLAFGDVVEEPADVAPGHEIRVVVTKSRNDHTVRDPLELLPRPRAPRLRLLGLEPELRELADRALALTPSLLRGPTFAFPQLDGV
jgi:hypothetical protein